MDIEIDVLRDWIDNRLADLVRSKASRLQERQRQFVDGSIDTLLGLRSQFCTSQAARPAASEHAPRSKARSGRSRKLDASEATQTVC